MVGPRNWGGEGRGKNSHFLLFESFSFLSFPPSPSDGKINVRREKDDGVGGGGKNWPQ